MSQRSSQKELRTSSIKELDKKEKPTSSKVPERNFQVDSNWVEEWRKKEIPGMDIFLGAWDHKKLPGMVKSYQDQCYRSLKRECISSGEPFVDAKFPPNNDSIFNRPEDAKEFYEWKRPGDICKVPKLTSSGVSCDDLLQGELGNGWFVSACASLATDLRIWNKVVPNHEEQDWGPDKPYAGIFHFQFWRNGDWIDVVVDDLLPTKNGELVFCHSKCKNEFWSALLEKAYAKLYGSYENLRQGFTSHALVDFTGGIAERIALSSYVDAREDKKEKLFVDMEAALTNGSLLTCHIECPDEQIDTHTDDGLLKGKSYSITLARTVSIPRKLYGRFGPHVRMVRLLNPWGSTEWMGTWSDNSEEWSQIPRQERERIGLKFAAEGEFWMQLEDFVSQFTHVEICHIVNTSIFSLKTRYHECMFKGSWYKSSRELDRCGGNDSHPTFLSNPQYMFDVWDDDTTMMFSLEQKDKTVARQRVLHPIGFVIMKVEVNRKYRCHLAQDKYYTCKYEQTRSVFGRVVLKTGRYVILPTTQDPGMEQEYLLRIYSTANPNASELIEDHPDVFLPCFLGYANITRLCVARAEGLPPPAATNTMDPYCIVRCEGESVKGAAKLRTHHPEWALATVFYRKRLDRPILIEVWNKNMIKDDFLGQTEVHDIGMEELDTVKKLFLFGRGKEVGNKKEGMVTIVLRSSGDLDFF